MNNAELIERMADDARPLFVSAEAVRTQSDWPLAIAKLRHAYSSPHSHREVPPRTIARGAHGWLRTMSAIPNDSRFMGAKIFGIGTRRMVNYLIVLIEQDSGLIAGFVDGGAVTAIRTAATSALAIDRLSRAGSLRVGMLGSGEEARAHLAALAAIRPIDSLSVYSPTPARRNAFVSQHGAQHASSAIAVDTREAAARDCDVLIAAARSHDETPIVTSDMLEPGKLVVSIGSTMPEQREIDVSVVAGADLIVCDAVEEVANETGDMLAARDAGIEFLPKMISLNGLMAGDHDSLVAQSRHILFKSVGSAFQDIVIAELAYQEASRTGMAVQFPFEFHTKYA